MPCYYPLRGNRLSDGSVGQFRQADKWSLNREIEGQEQVPCGRCVGCRIDNKRSWAIRAMHEASLSPDNCFITLTYDDDHVPEGHTLRKTDFQKFLKRMRYRYGSFSYMLVGEYGPTTLRPHAHALIFGLDFSEGPGEEDLESGHWSSEMVSKCWKFGYNSVGTFTEERAAYVAGYCLKKLSGSRDRKERERIDPDTGEVWHVDPEFFLMSRNPAIGKRWFEKYHADCFPSDFVIDHNGNKAPVPPYYETLYERENGEAMARVRAARKEAEKLPEWEALKASEKTLKARSKLFSKGPRAL